MTTSKILVVDASVAVKWVLREPGRERAMDLLAAYADQRVYLIAPRLLREEVASAISKRFRRGLISAAEAASAVEEFDRRRPVEMDTPTHLHSAMVLSLTHQLSFWDSLYLALAIDYGGEIVTADARFYRNVNRHYASVTLIL